jgi:hypothetical protein
MIVEMKYLKILALLMILGAVLYRRIPAFTQIGKDVHDHERAVLEFLAGRNPYEWTIESYANETDMGDHGFAYLPGFLYMETYLYILASRVDVPFYVLWKVPVLIADLGVGFLLAKRFWRRSDILTVVAPAFWFFNPYAVTRPTYTFLDPVVVLLMLISLIYLQKDSVLSGTFFALSIIFKTFPVILFPIFFLLTKDKVKFILSCALIGILFSIPFMRSLTDFETYLQGSLFVHSERQIQGRPFLFYISYFYDIELFQIINLKLYSITSIFGSWLLSSVLYLLFKVKDKYVLSLVSFLCFYTFTPVLNRTYLIWFLPILIIGSHNISMKLAKKVWVQRAINFLMLSIFYVFYYWYITQWTYGFHDTLPD